MTQSFVCREATDLPGNVSLAQVGGEIVARKVEVAPDLPAGVLCVRVDGVVYARPSVVKRRPKR